MRSKTEPIRGLVDVGGSVQVGGESFDTDGAAAYIGCTGGYLTKLRGTGEGPPFHRLSLRQGIICHRADVDTWLSGRRFGSTSEYPETRSWGRIAGAVRRTGPRSSGAAVRRERVTVLDRPVRLYSGGWRAALAVSPKTARVCF